MDDDADWTEIRELTMQLQWKSNYGYSTPNLQQATKVTRFYKGELWDEHLEWADIPYA